MTGPNGNTPFENLRHLNTKPIFEKPADIPYSQKCPTHPTKQAWAKPIEAIREAEARTDSTKIQIVAYRCDACGEAHLCKAESVKYIKGTVLERPAPELPLVLGNGDAKRRVLAAFLADRTEVHTSELEELLGIGRKGLTPYMKEAGWYNTRGRHARWIPTDTPVVAEISDFTPPPKERHLKTVDDSMSRHPAAAQVGWRPMTKLDPIRHMPLGDLIDTLHAAGMEVRIQVREG